MHQERKMYHYASFGAERNEAPKVARAGDTICVRGSVIFLSEGRKMNFCVTYGSRDIEYFAARTEGREKSFCGLRTKNVN